MIHPRPADLITATIEQITRDRFDVVQTNGERACLGLVSSGHKEIVFGDSVANVATLLLRQCLSNFMNGFGYLRVKSNTLGGASSLNGVVLSAVGHERGIDAHLELEAVEFAVFDQHGRIIETGEHVAQAVRYAVIASIWPGLIESGYVKVKEEPLGLKFK